MLLQRKRISTTLSQLLLFTVCVGWDEWESLASSAAALARSFVSRRVVQAAAKATDPALT